MSIQSQLVISLIVSFTIGIPILLYLHNKYKKEGKSIKFLEFKVCIFVAIPIISIPFLLSNKLSIVNKLIIFVSMIIAGIIYAYTMTSARKAFRKLCGLLPEDEHTGDVINKDKDHENG